MANRVRFRHVVYNKLLRGPVRLFGALRFHYHSKGIYKIKKDENVIVLANHQTDFDPLWVTIGFNRPLYFVATDTLFSSKVGGGFLKHVFAPIPKKKGDIDPSCVKGIIKTIKEGGSVAIFPEGNRTYAEFQFFIDVSIARLIKKLNKPLILYNLCGGTGVNPRFSKKLRKGPYYGYVKKVLRPEDYASLSNEELLQIIKDNLRVYDSESNNLYKSKIRGENLERMLFVCPKCHKAQTLHSHNEFIKCSSCGLEVEYTEDMHFKSKDPNFNFDTTIKWYEYQKKWVKEFDTNTNENIFEDDNVKVFLANPNVKRELLSEGNLTLTKDLLIANNLKIDVKDIRIASVVSGRKFNFSTSENEYLVVGDKKFNPLKYVLMFNRLDTYMKEHQSDKYYNLEEGEN